MESTKAIIYDFIVNFILTNNYSPSVREIMDNVGLYSTSTVWYYLQELKNEGKICFVSGCPRTITIEGYQMQKI